MFPDSVLINFLMNFFFFFSDHYVLSIVSKGWGHRNDADRLSPHEAHSLVER